MGILSGLENLGVKIKEEDIYADNKKKLEKQAEVAENTKKPGDDESDFIIGKTYTCPVCGSEFKSLTVKASKARFVGSDIDLRPKYEQLDTLKYGVVMCPMCGYAALSRDFGKITDTQKKNVREQISKSFHTVTFDKSTYSYDDAIQQYQMTLANAIIKKAKSSEKAYICLMMAWVVRGKAESLDINDPGYLASKKECDADEKELLKNSLEGFSAARSTEDFPMCGMDEDTIDYLIAALFYECGEKDKSLRMLSQIITSRTANSKIKDKARDLKDQVMASKKN